jgi:single-strand DNA-binding protein
MSYSDINRVVLVGRLTRDPELRALPSGHSVCSLRLASNGFRKDGDAYQERPNYFDVSAYGAQGESIDRYMRKGSRVVIDGHLEWREWETSDRSSEIGQHKRQAVSVVAETVQFLDSPNGAQRGGEGVEGELEPAGAGAAGGEEELVF